MLDKRGEAHGIGYQSPSGGSHDSVEGFPGTDIPPLADDPAEGLPF